MREDNATMREKLKSEYATDKEKLRNDHKTETSRLKAEYDEKYAAELDNIKSNSKYLKSTTKKSKT